jgi:hypothetical protein
MQVAKSKITLGQVDLVAQAAAAALQVASVQGARIHLRELLRSLAPHGENLEAEKTVLVTEYAEKDADGKPIELDGIYQFGDNQATVDAKWRDLNATQVNVVHRLTFDDVAGLPADPALDALELVLT